MFLCSSQLIQIPPECTLYLHQKCSNSVRIHALSCSWLVSPPTNTKWNIKSNIWLRWFVHLTKCCAFNITYILAIASVLVNIDSANFYVDSYPSVIKTLQQELLLFISKRGIPPSALVLHQYLKPIRLHPDSSFLWYKYNNTWGYKHMSELVSYMTKY